MGPRARPAESKRAKGLGRPGPVRSIDADVQQLIGRIAQMGPAEADMVQQVLGALERKPEATISVAACLAIYGQIRHMFDRAATVLGMTG